MRKEEIIGILEGWSRQQEEYHNNLKKSLSKAGVDLEGELCQIGISLGFADGLSKGYKESKEFIKKNMNDFLNEERL